VAAETVLKELSEDYGSIETESEDVNVKSPEAEASLPASGKDMSAYISPEETQIHDRMVSILLKRMGLLRTEEMLELAREELSSLEKPDLSRTMKAQLMLARAILLCALNRRESRGAHTRLDYPDLDEAFRKTTKAVLEEGRIQITYEEITPYPAA
jgi:succinate dehydrogenase/fumarate reductase flavoprotein subunit